MLRNSSYVTHETEEGYSTHHCCEDDEAEEQWLKAN